MCFLLDDSAAIDWRTNTLAASPPRNGPGDDAAAAAAAEAATKREPNQATLASQPSGD